MVLLENPNSTLSLKRSIHNTIAMIDNRNLPSKSMSFGKWRLSYISHNFNCLGGFRIATNSEINVIFLFDLQHNPNSKWHTINHLKHNQRKVFIKEL